MQQKQPENAAETKHSCSKPECREVTLVDRRRQAKPPKTRGKRGRPTIEEIPGVAEWMETQFKQVPRPSFREIEARLMMSSFWPTIIAAGRRTGKTSIHTWWVKWSADMARKRVASEYAEAFNQGSGKDILEIETAITGLANIAILESLRQELDGDKSVTDKVSKLVDLHRKLQSSSARREAERRAAGRIERRAYANARAEISEILKQQPEAQNLVLAAIDKAQRAAEADATESIERGKATAKRLAA